MLIFRFILLFGGPNRIILHGHLVQSGAYLLHPFTHCVLNISYGGRHLASCMFDESLHMCIILWAERSTAVYIILHGKNAT